MCLNQKTDAQNWGGAFSHTKKLDFYDIYETLVRHINAFICYLGPCLRSPIEKNNRFEKIYWSAKCVRMPHILDNPCF